MKKIKLLFDKRAHPFGSKEHFWHFKLGYLLPSIHYYFKTNNNTSREQSKNSILIYEDCGPLMNPHIEEMAELMGIPYEIISSKVSSKFDNEVFLPRWDIRLYISFYFLSYKYRYNSDIPINIKDIQWFISKSISFRQKDFSFNIKRDLLYTRNLILSKIKNKEQTSKPAFLFIDRSDLHSYYKVDGKAELKGYGKSRRALLNLKEKCSALKNEGINCMIYQPGSHSMSKQIKVFQESKGIVAIRGAELANLLWLKPKSKVVVIGFNSPAFHLYNFASLLNLRLCERKSDTNFPKIDDFPIKTLINE